MKFVEEVKRDINFAISCGKTEYDVKVLENEVHIHLGKIAYFVLTPEEFEEVKSVLPQQEAVSKVEGLTTKESNVLQAMYNNTLEIGLPVEVNEIKEDTGYSKRSIVGVISSLYKKGLVESYDLENDNEFMLSEKGYKIAEG